MSSPSAYILSSGFKQLGVLLDTSHASVAPHLQVPSVHLFAPSSAVQSASAKHPHFPVARHLSVVNGHVPWSVPSPSEAVPVPLLQAPHTDVAPPSSYKLVSGFRQDGVALDASHLSLEAHLHIPVATSHVLALPVQSELAAHSLHDPSSKHLWVDVVQLP